MKIAVILISTILLVFTLINILIGVYKSESKKEGIALLLLIFEPVDTIGYLFYIGLFGVIAGLLIL